MHKTYKILVSCYACGPNKGSEPGMGWNFVLGLRRYNEVHVIVEKRKWEIPITEFLKEHPEYNTNLKFYFIDKVRNKWLRKIWPPSYYWFYKQWQKKAFKLALQLDKREDFDLMHQLNMVGYREPGYLWQIQKPFVWGPIGGLENSPWSFLPSLGAKGMVFYTGRNIINWLQRNFSKRPKQAAKRNNVALIAATPQNQMLIDNLWGVKSTVMCEVGQEVSEHTEVTLSTRQSNDPLKIVWSGLHTHRKNLPLLIKAMLQLKVPVQLDVLGKGELTHTWKQFAKVKGVHVDCIWHGWVERNKAIDIMRKGHVFCITSVSDLTSTVTLEALSYGLPIICLDHCGFSHVVTDDCGIKIPVTNPTNASEAFAAAIEKLYTNEDLRYELAKGALKRSQDFSWAQKIKQLYTIYDELIHEG